MGAQTGQPLWYPQRYPQLRIPHDCGACSSPARLVQGSERKLQWEAPVGSLMQFPAIAHRTFPSMQPGDAATLAGASILVVLAIDAAQSLRYLLRCFLPSFGSCQALDTCHLCGTLWPWLCQSQLKLLLSFTFPSLSMDHVRPWPSTAPLVLIKAQAQAHLQSQLGTS